MDDDFIREQIEALADRGANGQRVTFGWILAACWPGGPADRAHPAAMSWLRHWHPTKAAANIPLCTCATGRCRVCN